MPLLLVLLYYYRRGSRVQEHILKTLNIVWLRQRVEEVIGQLSTVLDDDQIEDTVQAFKRKGLL